jgi:hypothetical protein
MAYLCKALEKNFALEYYLEIDENEIDSRGIEKLKDALKFNSSLVSLNLLENNLGNDGAKIIGECLKHNSSLQNIFLRKTRTSERGLASMIKGLKVNYSLGKIDMRENSICWRNHRSMYQALEQSKKRRIDYQKFLMCAFIRRKPLIEKKNFEKLILGFYFFLILGGSNVHQ